MSLTRGTKSNFPCPRCLIPTDEQGNYPPEHGATRTSAHTQVIIQEARAMRPGRKEELLKSFGLRDIDVCVVFSFFLFSLMTYPTERVLENRELRPI